MQEGSAKLGSGHEDTVGQEEVAEECLCRARTGDRWGLQWSSLLSTSICTAGAALSPIPPRARDQRCPIPVTALPTQTKNTGMRTSRQLTKWTKLVPDEVRRQGAWPSPMLC